MRALIPFLMVLALDIAPAEVHEYDVAVYGGTAGGVMTAVTAAREGASAAVLEPGRHVGGMVTGGLGRTDFGRKEVIGGYALEFYRRLGREYGKEIAWFPEPRVAEKVLLEVAAEAGVRIFYQHRLREAGGVEKKGARLTAIHFENGSTVRARVFADATYEGDLMAQAGVSFTVGRESAAQYGEDLAGVRPKDPNHQFDDPIPARDEEGILLPEIGTQPRGEVGAGDRKVQAYNFRLCLSDDPGNQVGFEAPEGYDARRYELLARYLASLRKRWGSAPRMNEILIVSRLEEPSKTDINNRGAFSTDYIGASWDYPTASYARRGEIWEEHVRYTKGLLYFLAHDPKVPVRLQRDIQRWGLCRDEFQDNGHWPHQLYVREARRMRGDFVMTQKDIQTELSKPDVIGMGSYNSDSHNVQRFVEPDGTVQNEGNMEVPVTPYQIPYRLILPKQAEAENLLVPVCFSASHVTYSTLRMEPQYMIIGQAAGVAAKMAIDAGRPVQNIDTEALTAKLKAQGAVFEYRP